MKRLIIHIGTHKTGTSSFQRYCYKFRELLSEEGVCYPLIKGHENLNNHSVLAWALDKIDQESGSKMLNNAFSQFKDNKHHTLLISSEDLENSLIGSEHLEKILASARNFEFNSFEIVVAERDPFEYLSSIYAELSKQNLIINFSDIASAAASYGYFNASTPHFNYSFAIHTNYFVNRLSEKHPYALIRHYSLKDFVNIFPGESLLASITSEDATQIMKKVGLKKKLNNIKLDPLQVEINYALNTIKRSKGSLGLDESQFKKIVMSIAKDRLLMTNEAKQIFSPKMKTS